MHSLMFWLQVWPSRQRKRPPKHPSSANLGCLSADHTDMDILLSALASDLVSRLVSFVVDKCRKQAATEKLARLQNLLLRARTVVEEAEGRHITNRGMLLQLQELRKAMYRGYYMLHAHTCKKETIDQSSEKRHAEVSQSFHLDSLQRVLHSLESTIGDMKELAVLLMDCPRIVRQPYSTYLFMDRCMFGRHAEKEKIMDFLLQPCSFLAVLPIIGPCQVGKRTLVEHVCIDKKVRKHFCQVQHLTGDNLDRDQPFQYSRGRSLIVIEFLLHVGEEAWRRFYSSICQTNSDSKIIIISRMKQVASFGTVQALELKRLHQYEFYYFFKVLAFGSVNPDDHHPVLTAIATNLASESKGSFIAANVLARLLQTNLNAHFWRHVQKMIREIIQLYCAHFGEHPCSLSWENRPYYYCGYFRESLEDASLFVADDTRRNFTQKELPKLTLHDLITGAGRSIPPMAGDGEASSPASSWCIGGSGWVAVSPSAVEILGFDPWHTRPPSCRGRVEGQFWWRCAQGLPKSMVARLRTAEVNGDGQIGWRRTRGWPKSTTTVGSDGAAPKDSRR